MLSVMIWPDHIVGISGGRPPHIYKEFAQASHHELLPVAVSGGTGSEYVILALSPQRLKTHSSVRSRMRVA